jgi:predicted DNA-binding protein (MmcQ/YjbR family)
MLIGAMHADEAREYLLQFAGTSEETPFGPEVLVYKVHGKMFATLVVDESGEAALNLKCDPDRALELREAHRAVLPGYHMNKKHWNTLILDRSLPPILVRELIDHSRNLVVAGLPKRFRDKG